MNKIKFRFHTPKRTYKVSHSDYTDYKSPLAKDFMNRCGYCDCEHSWLGGIHNFHIEHFAPISLFPEWKTNYSNLIYACSHCNIAKSDDWVSSDKNTPIMGDKGYIDPCDTSFEISFSRLTDGSIFPENPIAKYMYIKLKLYLERKRIIWTIDRIYQKIRAIKSVLDANPKNTEVKEIFNELSLEFFNYLEYLHQS